MTRKNIIRRPYCRPFSTTVRSPDSNMFLYVFGVLASFGIAGGIYFYSSSLQVVFLERLFTLRIYLSSEQLLA